MGTGKSKEDNGRERKNVHQLSLEAMEDYYNQHGGDDRDDSMHTIIMQNLIQTRSKVPGQENMFSAIDKFSQEYQIYLYHFCL